jgi:phospholipid/cholesterol/gamma-HCH transport system substrate-binding protein
MKYEERKRSVIVGIFILISIVIFTVGVLILGGQQNRFESAINLYTVFDDVEGLQKGNNVWFSGVKVGTVKEISFHGQNQVEVTMRIVEDVQQYIRKDSKVKISSEGLIGNKILVIEEGSMDAPVVEPEARLESISTFDTENIMVTLQKNNQNLVDITNDFKEITSRLLQGSGTVGSLLFDSTLANNMKTVVENLEDISANSVMASRALNRFTSKLNNEEGLANQMLTDTVVFSQLRMSARQLQETSETIAALTENLNQATEQLTEKDNSIGVLLNDEEFSEKLKSTMTNLETGTAKLDENMEALQSNFLFRGYFRRQEKARQKEMRTQDSKD